MADFKINPVPRSMVAVPSNTENLTDSDDKEFITTAIRIGEIGDVKVMMASGDITVYASGFLAPGIPHPMQVKRIYLTGTDVDVIVEWQQSNESSE